MDGMIKEIEDLVHQLTAFEKMYQQIRVVDPVKKKVIYLDNKSLLESHDSCYDIWAKGEICRNCISMRAYHENDTFIKMDYTLDRIMMVTAIPIELRGKRVVVELLKDVTKSIILDEVKLSDSMEVKDLLEKANIAVVTDALTQIYNKRFIMEKLPVEIVMTHLENESLSLIMADIDFFKKINDTYGHVAGDYILKEFAQTLKNNVRDELDWVARFGGEEFLICLKHTDRTEALIIAERMRKAVEEACFIYNDSEIKFTSSFGVYTIQDEKIADNLQLIEFADKNLYIAKNSGRNVVVG